MSRVGKGLRTRVAIHLRIGDFSGADEGTGALGRGVFEVVRLGRPQQVESQVQIDLPGEEAVEHGLLSGAYHHRRFNRPALLRQAGVVGQIHVFALHHGRVRNEMGNRHHARSTTPHSEDRVRPVQRALRRLWQLVQRLWAAAAQARALGRLDHGKGRALAVDAQPVLGALSLPHLRLVAELGRHAVERSTAFGLGVTVAAALANILVNEHVFVGRQTLTATATALLGGALLIEDDHRGPGNFLKLLKGFGVALQAENRNPLPVQVAIARSILADDPHLHYPQPQKLLHDIRHRPLSPGRLPASECDRPVKKQQKGDVHLALDAALNRAAAAVEIASVAQVLVDVLILVEGCPAAVNGAASPHRGDVEHARVVGFNRPDGGAANGPSRLFLQVAEGVVRTAAAGHGRDAGHSRIGAVEHALQLGEALGGRPQTRPELERQFLGIHFAVRRNQRPPVLVPLAVHGLHIHSPQRGFDALFDKRARLLDHVDVPQSTGKGAHDFAVERVAHLEVQHRHAQPQIVEGLPHVRVAFAYSHNADPAARVRIHDAVEVVGADIRFHQRPLFLHQLLLHGQCARSHDDLVEALGKRARGQRDVWPHTGQINRARAIAHRRRQLERGYHASVARQGDRVQPQANDIFDAGRIENRHHAAAQHPIAGPRRDRALGAMIFSRQQDHRASCSRAAEVGQPHLVGNPHRAVRLAIPKGIYVPTGRKLAAQYGRGRSFFVDAELMHRAPQLVEHFELGDDLQIQPTQRRPFIASEIGLVDVAGGLVALLFFAHEAHNRLHAREKDPAIAL